MAFEHPAKFYVRYLLVVQPDPSISAVNAQLRLYGFSELKQNQYDDIVDGLADTPPGFKMHDRKHRPSVGWLKSMRIYSLVHRDDITRQLFRRVLVRRPLRELIERFILGGVSATEAAYRLKELGYPGITDAAVAEFAHYFWNAEQMGVADWANYFAEDGEQGRTGHVQHDYLAALHGGPQLAMYRAGISVEVDTKNMLKRMRDELWFTFQEAKSLPLTQNKVMMLGVLTRNLLRVDARLSASDSALTDVLRRFEKFRVIDDSSPVPSMLELAPGGTVSDNSRAEILRAKEKGH